MASRADNIASNLSLANFSKATELKQRISGSPSVR
jgi:preprotein translocase subunit SecY